MTAEIPLWNNGVTGLLSTQLSASKYSLNTIESERLCNVTPSKNNKVAPKNISKDNIAWLESELCQRNCASLSISCDRCKTGVNNCEETKHLLFKDSTLRTDSKAPPLSIDGNESQNFIGVDIKKSDGRKTRGLVDDKVIESESLLSNGCSTKSNESGVAYKNRKRCTKKLLLYLPYFLIAVSLIQVCLYIWDKGLRKWLVYSPSQRLQLWRFVTYSLMHSDVMHLLFNVVLQILIGAALEFEQGRIKTAAVYVGGCVAGAMGSSVLEPMLYICGSSGGVYAMLLSHLSHVWLNRNTLRYKMYRVIIVIVLVISDAAYTIAHWMIFTNTNPTISLPAHGAGAISGPLLGIVVYKGTNTGTIYTKVAAVLSAGILVGFVILTVLINLRFIIIYHD